MTVGTTNGRCGYSQRLPMVVISPYTLENYVTSGAQTYRVQAVGYFDKGGPAARIEAVVDVNGGKPRIVHWRDLTELNKGFNIPK